MDTCAKVILDSVSPDGVRLTTMELRYWRAIHSEFMTHRTFARNAASSRAIPFSKTRRAVLDCPFLPRYIGENRPGMQPGGELGDAAKQQAQAIIAELSYRAVVACEKLHAIGVHKAIANRYLEPWSYITVVVSGTEWANFFNLRCHADAEPHFRELACMVRAARDASTPAVIGYGDWHMPYLRDGDAGLPIDARKRISAARCARVSYLNHDGEKTSAEEDLALCARLIGDGSRPIHASPFEHVATPMAATCDKSCFAGWKQYREDVELT